MPIDQIGLFGYHNINAYGAVGDAHYDDTAAIQRAFTAVPNTGGKVFIPPGQYRLTSHINVMADRTEVEVDAGAVIVQSTVDYGYILDLNNHSYCLIDGLHVQGAGKETHNGRGSIHMGGSCTNNVLRNCRVDNVAGTGIVDDGNYNMIEGCFITETGEHGIYSSSAYGSQYIGNQIKDAGLNATLTGNFDSIKLSGSQQCVVHGNHIRDCVNGILLTDNATMNAILGNTVKGATLNEIRLASVTLNRFIGNILWHTVSGTDCIRITSGAAQQNDFIDNTIQRDAANGCGINWTGSEPLGADTVKGNRFYATVAHTGTYPAVMIAGENVTKVLVQGNYVYSSNWNTAYRVSGGGIANQFIYNVSNGPATRLNDGGVSTIALWAD